MCRIVGGKQFIISTKIYAKNFQTIANRSLIDTGANIYLAVSSLKAREARRNGVFIKKI